MVAQIHTLLSLGRLLLFDRSNNSLNSLLEQIISFLPQVYAALKILLDDLTLIKVQVSGAYV